jgi:hypothetical protein
MFGTCKECSTEVGYFKLTDRVCETCLEKSDTRVSKFKRLRNSMPVLEWLFPLLILFQLASPWILQANVSGYPKVDALTNTPDISTQFVFSIILLIILSIPLTLSFIIRFFIVRRRLHIVFTWIVLIFFIWNSYWCAFCTQRRRATRFNLIIFPNRCI